MKNVKKELKNIFTMALIVLGVFAFLLGVVFIKYKIWGVEHPQAKTWTFFINNKN